MAPNLSESNLYPWRDFHSSESIPLTPPTIPVTHPHPPPSN